MTHACTVPGDGHFTGVGIVRKNRITQSLIQRGKETIRFFASDITVGISVKTAFFARIFPKVIVPVTVKRVLFQ